MHNQGFVSLFYHKIQIEMNKAYLNLYSFCSFVIPTDKNKNK